MFDRDKGLKWHVSPKQMRNIEEMEEFKYAVCVYFRTKKTTFWKIAQSVLCFSVAELCFNTFSLKVTYDSTKFLFR